MIEQTKELLKKIDNAGELTLSTEECETLKMLSEYVASRCGGGEDIIGAILYTGAFHFLKNGDPNGDGRGSSVVDLTRKIEGREDATQ